MTEAERAPGTWLPPTEDLSMRDILEELDVLVKEALREGRYPLAASGRRVQALLLVMRDEFVRDVALFRARIS